MDHILYQIFKITLNLFKKNKKKQGYKIDNLSIRIYVNKIKNRIIFKIKTGYYLELLTTESMKLFGKTKARKLSKNAENMSYLEITEVELVHYYIVNNDYQEHSGVLYTFVSNKSFGRLSDVSPKNFIFLGTFCPGF